MEQHFGKQYSNGKGPEYASEIEKLKAENRFLKQQLDVLKYKELESVIPWKESIGGEGSVSQACIWLRISRATYYGWKPAY
ncbi:hypothetical protein YDYSG_27560 [Paenibacillus tyrfis]|nr:hypothetical protein YDYSG_27560 [Paenibacillus tyrfis]